MRSIRAQVSPVWSRFCAPLFPFTNTSLGQEELDDLERAVRLSMAQPGDPSEVPSSSDGDELVLQTRVSRKQTTEGNVTPQAAFPSLSGQNVRVWGKKQVLGPKATSTRVAAQPRRFLQSRPPPPAMRDTSSESGDEWVSSSDSQPEQEATFTESDDEPSSSEPPLAESSGSEAPEPQISQLNRALKKKKSERSTSEPPRKRPPVLTPSQRLSSLNRNAVAKPSERERYWTKKQKPKAPARIFTSTIENLPTVDVVKQEMAGFSLRLPAGGFSREIGEFLPNGETGAKTAHIISTLPDSLVLEKTETKGSRKALHAALNEAAREEEEMDVAAVQERMQREQEAKNRIDLLLRKSERCAAMMKSMLEKWHRTAAENNVSIVPDTVQYTLYSYQQSGVAWLALAHENRQNCILADEMGLGKTCQTISFLAWLKSKRVKGGKLNMTSLIVVPSSVIANWQREMGNCCPDLSSLVYYGSVMERSRLRKQLRREMPDAIITSYAIIDQKLDRNFFRGRTWDYLVLDEGHSIKNSESLRHERLRSLSSRHRLLLTGTPLQNDLSELWSLLSFLMPEVFSDQDVFSAVFEGYETAAVGSGYAERMRSILQPFVLRREKEDLKLELPVRNLVYIELEQTPWQISGLKQIRDDILTRRAAGERGASNALMEIRKATNHPLLCKFQFGDKVDKLTDSVMMAVGKVGDQIPAGLRFLTGAPRDKISQWLSEHSDAELLILAAEHPFLFNGLVTLPEGTSVPDMSSKTLWLNEYLPRLLAEGRRVLLFSCFKIVLDLLQVFLLDVHGVGFIRIDGETPVDQRMDLIDLFNSSESPINVALLTTRAAGLGINLPSSDTVIFFDIDYNPQMDLQAEARSLRIGNMNERVDVYKLITKKTIDVRMREIQDRKTRQTDEVMDFDNLLDEVLNA